MSVASLTALTSRSDLSHYGNNAHLLFALELRYQIEDIHTIAADVLTDGYDDKKCDLVYIDPDAGYVVVAQGYMSQDISKPAAPANKATDLNTAAAWLLNRPVSELPEKLRPAAEDIRSALADDLVKSIQFWYVHNLPGSGNVKDELRTVEEAVKSSLEARFPNANVQEVVALEVSRDVLEEWYQALQTPILVSDEMILNVPGGYQIAGDDWEAFVTAIPAAWLHSVFNTYKDKLFSANVRGYMGSRQSGSNINYGIKRTAGEDPGHFWVYNNGLTALVHELVYDEGRHELLIQGISIVNGAQTTGALGSLETPPAQAGMVQARFVKCSNRDTIQRIIEFNNRQNQVEASDFRSNDAYQRRLREEFKLIPEATYLGGRRGGHEDAIRRVSNLIPSDTAAQALAAFHQEPVIAYNQKSQIWISDALYSRYFSEQTHADHIVFAYSLLRSVESKKLALVSEMNRAGVLPEALSQQLDFLRHRGATFLLTSAIAKCLETFLSRAVPNAFRASFRPGTSPQTAVELWSPIVEATIPFAPHLLTAVSRGLKNADEVARVTRTFKSLVEATKSANTHIYSSFTSYVHIHS